MCAAVKRAFFNPVFCGGEVFWPTSLGAVMTSRDDWSHRRRLHIVGIHIKDVESKFEGFLNPTFKYLRYIIASGGVLQA